MHPARTSPLVLFGLLLITIYGALLRLDAFVGYYGPLTHPRWAAALTHQAGSLGPRLRPFQAGWSRVEQPYVGGDPINYLRFAREMRSFYQAHVREPMFVALTRGYLWVLDQQDAAVSFASITGSILIIVGTYLLAAAFVSPAWALLPAALVAIEYDFIKWGMYGWRDDLFAAAVVFTAWAFIRVSRVPAAAHAIVLGVCAATACLTRLSALSFIVPGLLWLALDRGDSNVRDRVRAIVLASVVCVLLVSPFIVNCWRVTGDPFFAVNYHTIYYRAGEGRAFDTPMSAREYIAEKLSRRPVATVDTAIGGMFIYPFVTKWSGLQPSLNGVARVLMWLAVPGLLLMATHPPGRGILIILVSSLVPYAFTWNIAGGGEWRFTMHAYPLYLVAAVYVISRMLELRYRPTRRSVAWVAAASLVLLLVGAAHVALPWFVVNEAIAAGEDTNIEAGARDRVFFADGWTEPHRLGITSRVSEGERAAIRFPLPDKRAYDIVLRLDPALPGEQRRLNVLLNGHFVALFTYTFDPTRVGSYRFHARAEHVNAGINTLTLVPDRLVTAGSAGERFASLPADVLVGVRLWYVRVLAGTS